MPNLNRIFNDNSLCFYGDFSSGHGHFDPQNTLNTQSSCSIILSGSTSTSQGETQLNYMPVQEDISYQPWVNTYVQQSNNEIQLIQNARKRSAEAGPCSLINSETNERDRGKKKPMHIQGKLPKIPKEKEPTVRRRSQKLTDKITTLQKLVSPYGKVATEKQPIIAILHNTDTASVLLEASVSIKALQDQIEEMFHMISAEQMTKMAGEKRSNLQSRGLCLVSSVILEELDQ
ncbi:hypothetical protein C2S52_020108 [Perilla frutescens var. hirtella]|nr:hypothetical protein C2S52_020108 [Perilla frutescens var. hirtella]